MARQISFSAAFSDGNGPGLDGRADHPVEAFHGIRNRYEVTGAQIPAVGFALAA
ncbi:hypothetical protein GI374_15635 [Paracoccus sp. S-4012]|uniref:hypothetical protein n=1 Tax=Paracoccus sp. S-4012 TaxID=2665648 RepID=UPI0012B08D61|nr:hypothetical protein [Paracoccus sp. S-4012]MRX51829.1 hypothetical protein [Paracoccus sp. S-4012]